ncbi:MAG: metallophosphoesterase family protein [Pseudomonadota bacterium]|nr:metallophosphoesterase family protein [Pseudomonadota bacterium]
MPLRAVGRGAGYSFPRAVQEAVLRRAYAGGWPARLWGRVPGALEVACRHGTLAVLPPGAAPLRLGFASDLHIGPTTPPALLDRAADLLAAADLDVLLLGGDYVFLEATDATAATLATFARRIPARHKLAVLGNHDLWTWHGRLERALESAGVSLLTNRAIRIGDVAVFGLDDPWTGAPDADAALAACGDASVRIGLVHSPDGMPLVWDRGVAALFCGHTHGGQVALPGGRPIIVPGPAGKVWPWGRHEVGGTSLFVSRGLGGVEVPFRANAEPDVWVVDVTSVGG